MNELAATGNSTNVVQIDINPAFIYGYDRALQDIRSGLSFDGGDHADLDIVLTLLERQNAKLREAKPVRK